MHMQAFAQKHSKYPIMLIFKSKIKIEQKLPKTAHLAICRK